MLTGLLALALIVMKSFPSTPLGRSLHLWLVEAPIEAAGVIERKHLILIAILFFCGPSLAAFGSAEVAMLYAVDLSLYVEAVLVTSVSAAGLSLKTNWATLSRNAARALRRGRPCQRSRRVRSAQSRVSVASNDDEPDCASWAA
jgi:hypothetical protein